MDAVQPNSPDVFQTPAWLTIEFLQDILRSHRKQQSLLVNSFTVKPAVAEGENYSSNVLRLGIKLTAAGTDAPQPEDVSLIVKIRLIDDKAPAVIEDMNCFGIETDAYFMVLPRVHWMLHLIGDYTQLAPKCLAADKRIGYLVFEDLSANGYYMVERSKGIEMPYFRLTLERLAKWHAATVRILEHDPDVGRKFLPAQFAMNSRPWRIIIENHVRTLSDYCAMHPHLAHLQPKLGGHVATIYDRLCKLCTDDSIGGLRALCHGDLWSNNILFHDELAADGKPLLADAKLIDFQQVFCGSPALDLLLLLHGTSHENLRQDDWDELIQNYHTVYVRTLRALGLVAVWRIPTLTELHVQMLRLCECGAYMSLLLVGFRNLCGMAEDPVSHYLSDCAADRQFRLDVLLDGRCTKSLNYLLMFYDRKGIFD